MASLSTSPFPTTSAPLFDDGFWNLSSPAASGSSSPTHRRRSSKCDHDASLPSIHHSHSGRDHATSYPSSDRFTSIDRLLAEHQLTSPPNTAHGGSTDSDHAPHHDGHEVLIGDEADQREDDGMVPSESDALRYELRPQRATTVCGATWLDHDTSGDYDPEGNDTSLFVPPKKRKREARPYFGNVQGGSRQIARTNRVRSYLRARQQGYRLVVTLPLRSASGMELLKRNEDSCPLGYEEDWNLFEERESSDDTTVCSRHHLRKRAKQRYAYGHCSYDVDGNIGVGWPEARGCKACFSIGEICSMREPDGTYPCDLCVEDDCDCEMLVEPPQKRACELCRKLRFRCSYQDSQVHSGPCEGCQDAGFRCIAGPLMEPNRTRIGHDGKPATIHEIEPKYKRPPPRVRGHELNFKQSFAQHRYLTCTRCRQEGKRCGLRAADSVLPCQHCAAAGLPCHLRQQNTVTAPHLRKDSVLDDEAARHFKQLAVSMQAPTFTPKRHEVTISSTPPPLGKLAIIRTRLLHPLNFNAPTSCNWCDDPLYGLFGVGVHDRVKVRLWPNGKGCTELARQTQLGPHIGSNMCPDCTMDRVMIMTCEGHSLKPFNRSDDQVLDMSAALQELEQSAAGDERKTAERRFCTTCPALATGKCCTGADDGCGRCGLRFCDACAILFEALFERDLQNMVRDINRDDEAFPNGLRADYDFFATDSYLMKQVMTDD